MEMKQFSSKEESIIKTEEYLRPIFEDLEVGATKATIYEIAKKVNPAKLLESLREWEESQVMEFCSQYRDKLKDVLHGSLFKLKEGYVYRVKLSRSRQLRVDKVKPAGALWRAGSSRRIVSLH